MNYVIFSLFRIAPLKEEEAYLDPRIVLYREALFDPEIEVFKKLAQPRVSHMFNSSLPNSIYLLKLDMSFNQILD